MTFKTRETFTICCDTCKAEMDTDNGEFSEVYFSRGDAEEHADCCDWYVEDGKHICPTCPWPKEEEVTE